MRTVTREHYQQSLKPVVDALGGLPLQQLTRQHVEDLVDTRLATGRVERPNLSVKATAVLAFVASHGDGGCTYRQVEAEFGVHGPKQLDRLRAGGLVDRPARGRYVATRRAQADQATMTGVSPSTVNTILTLLSSALRQAVADGVVVRNVAEYVERPKHTATKTPAWEDVDVAAFRRHIADERERALWLLTLAGLRRSEILGLSWSAIDFSEGSRTVEAGRVPVKGGTELGDPKSWRSVRTLPIPTEYIDALRAFKATQAAERLVAGASWPDTGLVAVTSDGTPIVPRTYSASFRRLTIAAGVAPIQLRGVRNTAASTLIAARLSPVDAAAWLGHDPAMTLRVYAHARREGLVAAADALTHGAPLGTLGG